jgi:hypothetical protein
MSDAQLLSFIRRTTPQLNPDIVNGIAAAHMTNVEADVDAMFKTVAKGFPPGLEYLGGTPCTPEEEFHYLSRRRPRRGRKKPGVKKTAREFDIAQSDTYMVKYAFRYRGETILKYLSLPFVRDGGIIYLSGTRNLISPIIADQAISHTLNGIFVIFSRAKVKIERNVVRFFRDGQLETVYQPYARIHNKTRPKHSKLRITINTTLFHYLLCKYGFHETMMRFAGVDARLLKGDDFSEDQYPSKDWVICKTATMTKPRTYYYPYYTPPDLVLLVPRGEYEKRPGLIGSMIGSFFYLADHFPRRIRPEDVDNTRLWRVLLGLVLWGDSIGEGALHDDISDHIESLDEYVDERLRSELRPIGINITDIYEFFAVIISDISDWVLSNREKISSLYDKKLSVVYYVLYDLLAQINMSYFRITASAKKRELTPADVKTHLNLIKQGFIYGLLKSSGAISTTSSPNGNKALKLTVMMVPQSNSKKKKRKSDKKRERDPSKALHVSNAEVGGYCTLTKTEPSALARINPCVRTNERGIVLRNPEFKELLDRCQELIKQTAYPSEEAPEEDGDDDDEEEDLTEAAIAEVDPDIDIDDNDSEEE